MSAGTEIGLPSDPSRSYCSVTSTLAAVEAFTLWAVPPHIHCCIRSQTVASRKKAKSFTPAYDHGSTRLGATARLWRVRRRRFILGLFTLLITFLFKIVRGKPPARPWHLAGAEAPVEAAEQVAVRVTPPRPAVFQPHGKVRARPGPSGEALCMAAPRKRHVVNDATRSQASVK